MFIKRLELENIKSYRDACYEFGEGVIAIIGENGSGKTTIIEAIAWALFNVLEYKKNDFVRHGQKRGTVRVTFTSPTDGREYIVHRDTSDKYEIYDPQNKIRIAQGKSEVMSFLHKALGIGNVDLQTFFKCAIGVPQGTFTADFLLSTSERKSVFDRLLKVEEYKQASESLLSTQRYGEQRESEIIERILRMEGEIKYLKSYEVKIKEVETEIHKLSNELRELKLKFEQKSKSVEKLNELEKKFVELENDLRQLRSEKQRNEELFEQKRRELEEAEQAVKKIAEVEKSYLRHQEIEENLKELDQKRSQRNKLLENKNTIEIEISKLNSSLEKLKEDLQKQEEALVKIDQLKALVPKQEELEKTLEEAQGKVHVEKNLREQLRNLEKKIEILRKEYEEKNKQSQELEKQLQGIEDYDLLNASFNELTEQITYLQAKFEAEEKFKREIKNGLCPILAQKCLNLREGETLESFVNKETSNLSMEIKSLKAKREVVKSKLQVSREAERKRVKLEGLKADLERIMQEGKSLRKEQEELNAELEKIEKSIPNLSKIKKELEDLGNPKAQIRLLEEEIKKKPKLQEKISQTEKQISQLFEKAKTLKIQIDSFGDVELEWQRLSKEREDTLEAYKQYLKYEKTAKTFPKVQQEFSEIKGNLENLAKRLSEVERDFADICKIYNREQHEAEKCELQIMEVEQAQKKAELGNFQREFENCNKQIEKLEEIRKQMKKENEEKQKIEKVLETVQFVRETLKISGPLVVKNLISQISNKANRIFQEIMDNHEVTLEWTEDYSILLEEKGYKRPFVNLSGGEQMAAALAVRLAFLLLLSDIRIAFFDEPTTNMDAVRCEKLAQQIERISNSRYFNQLFVISHDSTFESLVDKPIYVSKQ
jgi:DNA repair protein SbcC/Rad50